MKKNTSRIHYEILDRNRLNLLNNLLGLIKNFVLSGGTALALQINHRQSFDFDFFSDKEISANLLARLGRVIQVVGVLTNTPDELSVMNSDEIKISFIYYPFKSILPLVNLKNGLKTFAVREIAAQKAYTIGRRGTYRDYFDIYTVLKNKHLTLKEIITTAEQIYGGIFSSKLFLEQLVYFDDLTNFEIMPINGQPVPDKQEVEKFLTREVKEYLSNYI